MVQMHLTIYYVHMMYNLLTSYLCYPADLLEDFHTHTVLEDTWDDVL